LRKTINDRKREILADLVAARRDILEVVAALPPERVDEIFLGEWTVKDLIAHLIGWDATNRQAVMEILAGQSPTFFQYYDKDWQSYNRSLVAKYKLEPFAALLATVENSHHELISFLDSIPAKELLNSKARTTRGRTVTIHNLLRAEARDERVHAEQVRTLLS
jgi:hypothetical protein